MKIDCISNMSNVYSTVYYCATIAIKLLFPCRQYIPKQQKIVIDFSVIDKMNSLQEITNGHSLSQLKIEDSQSWLKFDMKITDGHGPA